MVPRELIEADETITVERDVGEAIKTMAAQHPLAYRYILTALAGVDRASFVYADDSGLTMAFREGRRFVGRHLRRIVETPLPAAAPEGDGAAPMQQTTTARIAAARAKRTRRK